MIENVILVCTYILMQCNKILMYRRRQPTDSYGQQCSFLGDPYINNCNYDGAFYGLDTLYGDIVKGTGTE